MRRVVVYLVLAGLTLLIGAVGLSGELNANFYEVDGTVVGTATRTSGGINSGGTTYYVLIRREDTGLREKVRHAGLYDAVRANDETHATLEIEDVGQGVESVNRVRYLDKWYGTGRATAGKVVGAVFLGIGLLLLWLAFRRWRFVRRSRAQAASQLTGLEGPGDGF